MTGSGLPQTPSRTATLGSADHMNRTAWWPVRTVVYCSGTVRAALQQLADAEPWDMGLTACVGVTAMWQRHSYSWMLEYPTWPIVSASTS